MIHAFEVEVAVEFSLEEAVAIHAFAWWIGKNRAAGRHIYADRCWTCCSVETLSGLWPYWSPGQVRRVVDRLVERGVLLRECWAREAGRSPYDRTSWYAFADEDRFLTPPRTARADLMDSAD
jgi:hypothetical protein